MMPLNQEAAKLLKTLVRLIRTEGDPDTDHNPTESRKERVLELRKKLVEALGRRAKAARHS
jgi:hypothetical protein